MGTHLHFVFEYFEEKLRKNISKSTRWPPRVCKSTMLSRQLTRMFDLIQLRQTGCCWDTKERTRLLSFPLVLEVLTKLCLFWPTMAAFMAMSELFSKLKTKLLAPSLHFLSTVDLLPQS